MKTNLTPSKALRSGFSLIELLVVVAIITILGGIVIVALGKMKQVEAAKLTRVNIKNIQMHVENYAIDNNGVYPVGDDVTSKALYRALSGDFTGSGEPPTGTTYWPELLKKDTPLTGKSSGDVTILDGYGQSFRYRSALDEDGNKVEVARNPDFDVWSIGPDNEPSDLNVSSLLDNDQTRDDIWQ